MQDPYERVEYLQGAWADARADKTPDDCFIPYIQLHEFEAYLFCDVSQFASVSENAERQIEALGKVAADFQSPELIDEKTPPSKRIKKQFPEYDKVSDGPPMAKEIGLENIRSQCPHFDRWITRLENLGAKSRESH